MNMTFKKDNIFLDRENRAFEFDSVVASVFDDMINRSVPFYQESLDLVVEYLRPFLKDGDMVVDLGCSTANTLIQLSTHIDKKIKLIGVDNSKDMLSNAKHKIQAYGVDIRLIKSDIFKYKLHKPKVVILNYTLQFLPPNKRASLIKKIYKNTAKNSILILSEKLINKHQKLNNAMIKIYFDYKKQKGYSKTEIEKKKTALDNVLIPLTYKQNYKLLKNAGFKTVDTIFRWNNFATFIAIK